MSARYELWLSNHLGMRRTLGGFVLLDYWQVANGIGPLTLQLPRGLPLWWFSLDSQIEVWRAGMPEGVWLVRRAGRTVSDAGQAVIEVRGVSLAELLTRRIVAAAAGSAQAHKTGPADDVLRAIVREQFGAGAGAGRDISALLEVEPDCGFGPTIAKSFARRNVLRVLQEIAAQSAQRGTPLFFDVCAIPPPVAGAPTRYGFHCYRGARGQDHRYDSGNRPVVLAADFGTLADVERFEDHEHEITVMYAAGRGLDDQRVVVSAQDAARIGASPLNWREGYRDARHVALESALQAEAEAGLQEGQPVRGLRGRFQSTPQAAYGTHWRFGDLVSAQLDGEVVDCRVDRVHVVVNAHRETISGELRSDGAAVYYTAQERMEWAIDRTAIGEMPRVTQIPTPYGTPQADAAGHLAAGWLPDTAAAPSGPAGGDLAGSYPAPRVVALQGVPVEPAVPGDGELLVGSDGAWAIANISGIQGVTATPGATKVPLSDGDGHLADGWLSAAIARVAQLTWKTIAGKPSTFASDWTLIANKPATFTPSAHAHPWAEITDKPATFAPSAHAHPWAEITDKPASFAPSAHAASHKHGGGDELATATPAANAIPKADGSGWLDAWLSAAIARVASAATAGRLAYWSDAKTLAHDDGFTYDAANNRATVGALNLGSASGAGAGGVAYSGALQPVRGGTAYTGGAYVALTTMLVHASWDGVQKTTADNGWINVTTLFGVPSGATAVMVRLGAISTTVGLVARVGSSASSPHDRVVAAATFAASVPTTVNGVVSVVNNQIYFSVSATIATVSLHIVGYFL